MRILPKQIQLLAVIAVLALPALTLSSSTRSKLTARASTKCDRMGMGLAIVRSIIESHESELAAPNVESRGASVHFPLPAFAKGKAE
jgi:signal transduction histidine kinase